ncbi:MAG: hypothetical protein JXQ23_02755 [Clostridia bacterium]|nr:hypothetical protein [Clostridia bacterium]
MNREILIDLYRKRGFSEEKTSDAINQVFQLEVFLSHNALTLTTAEEKDIEEYVDLLIVEKKNNLETILALARYFYVINRQNIYIYFTKLLGGLGVLENIESRVKEFQGEQIRHRIFDDFLKPPLGTKKEDIPEYTKVLMKKLEANLDEKSYCKILAGNNHLVPREAMEAEKKLYEKSESLDTYLKERHQRKVAELQEYCDQKKVWYEQVITQEVVDFVKKNQEILSATRQGDILYVTKIPYEPDKYIKEEDQIMKRYYACHCTFAREAILKNDDVPYRWCYCSGGFAKFPFEVILDRELDVTVLKSALKGDDICRFAIKI